MMSAAVASVGDRPVAEQQLSPVGRIENVLLATDGSTFSAGAERVAIAFSAEHDAHLHILSAIAKPGETGWLGPQAAGDAETAIAENHARLEELTKKAGVECTTYVRSGDDPYEVIVETSGALLADVIIMGRRGRRGLARIMLGDATAKVIGYAPCSVLVVPEKAAMWTSILLATDGSRYSDMAAVTAATLAETGGVPLTVLSVKVPIHSERRQAEAQPIVDRVLEFLKEKGVHARGVVKEGLADEAIVEAARERQIGLIVLGNFGRTGIGRMLFGSKDERVINETDKPVLIVRGG